MSTDSPTPEPFVGAIYRATRNRTGRRWEVIGRERWGWHLYPLGGDCGTAGGVKGLWKSTDDLADRRRWQLIGSKPRP